jgi:hypothetical protein
VKNRDYTNYTPQPPFRMSMSVNAFHEKAGRSQGDSFSWVVLSVILTSLASGLTAKV